MPKRKRASRAEQETKPKVIPADTEPAPAPQTIIVTPKTQHETVVVVPRAFQQSSGPAKGETSTKVEG